MCTRRKCLLQNQHWMINLSGINCSPSKNICCFSHLDLWPSDPLSLWHSIGCPRFTNSSNSQHMLSDPACTARLWRSTFWSAVTLLSPNQFVIWRRVCVCETAKTARYNVYWNYNKTDVGAVKICSKTLCCHLELSMQCSTLLNRASLIEFSRFVTCDIDLQLFFSDSLSNNLTLQE